MPYLDRASFIELLESLGAEAEADALTAAREIHRRVASSGLSWDELLVQAPGAADTDRLEDLDDPDVDVGNFEIRDRRRDHPFEPADPAAARLALAYADELNLIHALLSRNTLSATTRTELLDLRADIFADDFADMDRNYLRDLAARLEIRSRDD